MLNKKFDDGFSIVELLVSVVLLAVLSIALVPNLVASMQASNSAKTRTLAIAVNRQTIASIEAAASTSCSALNAFVVLGSNQSVSVATGKVVNVVFAPASFACSATAPYSQTVKVSVSDSVTGVQLSSASTSVWITQ